MILRNDRKFIVPNVDFVGAQADHRLNGEHHAIAQARVGPRRRVAIKNRGVFVDGKPYAVATKAVDNAVAMWLDKARHGLAYILDASLATGRRKLLNRIGEAALGNFKQFALRFSDLPNRVRAGRIGKITIQIDTDVQPNDIPFLEDLLFVRNPVDDDFR